MNADDDFSWMIFYNDAVCLKSGLMCCDVFCQCRRRTAEVRGVRRLRRLTTRPVKVGTHTHTHTFITCIGWLTWSHCAAAAAACICASLACGLIAYQCVHRARRAESEPWPLLAGARLMPCPAEMTSLMTR